MEKLILIIAGSTVAFFILAYIMYIVFFPLVRTVGGGLQIFKLYGFKKSRAAESAESQVMIIHDAELGLTMADGGEMAAKEEAKKESVKTEKKA